MRRMSARHHEGPTEASREDVHLTITNELAGAIGPIAGMHNGTMFIWHAAEHDPENIWRVRVDEDEASWLYLVNDETGDIDPEPTYSYDGHRVR